MGLIKGDLKIVKIVKLRNETREKESKGILKLSLRLKPKEI